MGRRKACVLFTLIPTPGVARWGIGVCRHRAGTRNLSLLGVNEAIQQRTRLQATTFFFIILQSRFQLQRALLRVFCHRLVRVRCWGLVENTREHPVKRGPQCTRLSNFKDNDRFRGPAINLLSDRYDYFLYIRRSAFVPVGPQSNPDGNSFAQHEAKALDRCDSVKSVHLTSRMYVLIRTHFRFSYSSKLNIN